MIFLRIKIWNRIIGVSLILFSVLAFGHTYTFDYPRGGGAMVDIALFPRFLLIVLFILGFLLLFRKATDPAERSSITKEKYLLSLYIGLVAFTLSLPRLGFLISTFFWVAYICWLVGERKWWIILLTAFLGTTIGYYIFQVRLGIPLPEGSLVNITLPM